MTYKQAHKIQRYEMKKIISEWLCRVWCPSRYMYNRSFWRRCTCAESTL